MPTRFWSTTLVFLAALAWATASQAGTVKVPRSIAFAENARVKQAVKDQCQLQTRIPEYIAQFSSQVELVDGNPGDSGRVLEVTIEGVRSPGGGFYSGSKWIEVSGVLRENGKKIGDFTGKRSTIGYFNLTACSSAARCAKALGRDIAEWLENPKPNTTFSGD